VGFTACKNRDGNSDGAATIAIDNFKVAAEPCDLPDSSGTSGVWWHHNPPKAAKITALQGALRMAPAPRPLFSSRDGALIKASLPRNQRASRKSNPHHGTTKALPKLFFGNRFSCVFMGRVVHISAT
jgi:hypothetical protein